VDDERFRIWRKSYRSSGNDNCVEIATADDGSIGVRDSKNPTGGILTFSPHAWAQFVAGIRDGEFDA
jgi:Domain of unknown function (DUF397)